MDPATRALHETVIRLAKGLITAYERWLKEVEAPGQPDGVTLARLGRVAVAAWSAWLSTRPR